VTISRYAWAQGVWLSLCARHRTAINRQRPSLSASLAGKSNDPCVGKLPDIPHRRTRSFPICSQVAAVGLADDTILSTFPCAPAHVFCSLRSETAFDELRHGFLTGRGASAPGAWLPMLQMLIPAFGRVSAAPRPAAVI